MYISPSVPSVPLSNIVCTRQFRSVCTFVDFLSLLILKSTLPLHPLCQSLHHYRTRTWQNNGPQKKMKVAAINVVAQSCKGPKEGIIILFSRFSLWAGRRHILCDAQGRHLLEFGGIHQFHSMGGRILPLLSARQRRISTAFSPTQHPSSRHWIQSPASHQPHAQTLGQSPPQNGSSSLPQWTSQSLSWGQSLLSPRTQAPQWVWPVSQHNRASPWDF